VGELLLYLIPRKYLSIGHWLILFGGLMIIFDMIFWFISNVIGNGIGMGGLMYILGQSCLIIGLSGIYFSKTKNFRAVRKSEEKEGIEQKYSNGINGKALPPKYVYVFYLITIVGIVFSFYFLIKDIFLLIGDLLLLGGLLILYFKKRKESWYRLVNLPIRYRFAKLLKCKDCGIKFKSNIMQCPECNGQDLKML